MTITTFTGNYSTMMAFLLLTAACAAPPEYPADSAPMNSTWSEAQEQQNAALRRQAEQQRNSCASDEVPVCAISGRLGGRTCSCESLSETMMWVDETQMSEDY